MKKFFVGILIAFLLLTLMSSCAISTYGHDTDDIYSSSEITYSTIVRFGTPFYYDDGLSYYFYNGIYYYPYFYNGYYYFQPFRYMQPRGYRFVPRGSFRPDIRFRGPDNFRPRPNRGRPDVRPNTPIPDRRSRVFGSSTRHTVGNLPVRNGQRSFGNLNRQQTPDRVFSAPTSPQNNNRGSFGSGSIGSSRHMTMPNRSNSGSFNGEGHFGNGRR